MLLGQIRRWERSPCEAEALDDAIAELKRTVCEINDAVRWRETADRLVAIQQSLNSPRTALAPCLVHPGRELLGEFDVVLRTAELSRVRDSRRVRAPVKLRAPTCEGEAGAGEGQG